MVTTAPPYYDPYDSAIDADPHPVWKRLRDEAPLYYNEEYGFYALSRFADVHAASLDWETYSSAASTVLEMIDTTPGEAGDASYGMMIFMDPPGHDELRKLVSRAFTPRRVSVLEGRVKELCGEFLDPLVGSGSFDYLEDFAALIPTMVIGALLGVPKEDQNQLRIWGDAMLHYDPTGLNEERNQAQEQLGQYMHDMVEDRARSPRDDMVSDLLAAEITRDDGSTRRLTHQEVLAFFSLLELAGSETTARLLGWASVLLHRHPDQRALLIEQPDLMLNAVEELLRYEAPSPIQARFVTRDAEWHGQAIPANSKIALLTGAAGRDEREYPDADRFDVTRHFDRHLSFGYGIHYCIGANLARLEASIALQETLARFPDYGVDESKVEMAHTSTVRGPIHVTMEI